jgi:hypothetical protein
VGFTLLRRPIVVVESGKIVEQSGKKLLRRGLSPIQSVTDILTKSSFLTFLTKKSYQQNPPDNMTNGIFINI